MEFKKELSENEIKRAIRLFDTWENQNLIITHTLQERTHVEFNIRPSLHFIK